MTENEALDKLNNLHYKIVHTSFCNKVYESEIEALCMAKDCLKKIQQYRAIGTIEEFKQAMNFKKYFMELYGEGLEVANWHKNGDLEPLVNFIDEACN